MNVQAPKKSKIFRGNQKPHINKILRNAIMKRSQLKNKANKTKSVDDLIKYKKQRNLVVKLNKNCKKEFFDNLETKSNSKFKIGINASRNFLISIPKAIPIYC